MNYKILITAYLEESNQILVSFSSDETSREAADYQALAFDVTSYGNISVSDMVKEIVKLAPTICSDIVVAETYEADDEKSLELRDLVGQSFEYSQGEIEGLKVV
jgi:hypothetical protein